MKQNPESDQPSTDESNAGLDIQEARKSYLSFLTNLLADEIIDDLGLLNGTTELIEESKQTDYTDNEKEQDDERTT